MFTKDKLIFFDTNVLSDIGRLDNRTLAKLCVDISLVMKKFVVISMFNIIEIEKIQDEILKYAVYLFLDLCNVVTFKGAEDLFLDEITSYKTEKKIQPIETLSMRHINTEDGKPANFLEFINNFQKDDDHKEFLENHSFSLKQLQKQCSVKSRFPEDLFVYLLLDYKLKNIWTDYDVNDLEIVANYCPSYMAYAYSLNSKIGSKGLRNKAGEMNDTGMSYLFPYCGTVVTDKKHAALFNRLKESNRIPALKDTVILKHSDVIIGSCFKLEALSTKI